MGKNPLVTIFIPTFKRPRPLKNAIESALGQTWKNLQVIVCDNASNDETSSVVAELARQDSRLHYICHSQNLGMLGNYEYCLNHVASDYFSFLSDDDILLPNFCQAALDGFSQYPEIIFFACSTISLSKEHGVICVPLDIWKREGLYLPEEGFIEMIAKYPVPTTVLFHKKAVNKAKIDFENSIAWDCDFLLQLASQFPFAISKERCGIFFHHANSFSGSQDPLSSIHSIRRLIFRIRGFTWVDERAKARAIRQLQEAIYNNSFSRIKADIASGKTKDARKTCLHLLMTLPPRVKIFSYFALSLLSFIIHPSLRKKSLPQPSWTGFEKYQCIANESFSHLGNALTNGKI